MLFFQKIFDFEKKLRVNGYLYLHNGQIYRESNRLYQSWRGSKVISSDKNRNERHGNQFPEKHLIILFVWGHHISINGSRSIKLQLQNLHKILF